jgi:hypothetical protein
MLDLYFAEVVPTKKPDTQKQNDTGRRRYEIPRKLRGAVSYRAA